MQCENSSDPMTLKIVQCEIGINAHKHTAKMTGADVAAALLANHDQQTDVIIHE